MVKVAVAQMVSGEVLADNLTTVALLAQEAAAASVSLLLLPENFALLDSIEGALEQADQKIEEDVLGLALDIAKLMLKTKIAADPEVVLPVVRDAIHYLPHVQNQRELLCIQKMHESYEIK